MATRKKATTRRRMLARLYRGNTFHPDQVTISTNPPADEAARLEVRVIDLATTSATQTNPDRATFIRKLRRTVAYGLGRITRTATEAENTAKAAGTAAGQRAAARAADGSPQTDTTERLRAQGWGRLPGDQDDEDTTLGVPNSHPGDGKHLTARQARRVADAALQAPRSPETGNTVRVPKALADTFRDMAPTIIGSGSALYDDIVRELAANPPTSDADRRRTAQRVIDKFTERGITGLVDKGGRRWNLTTYVEMATRTAATNIARQAQTAALTRAGLDLVRVTVMPNCNPLCQPFQGRLLSLTGAVDRDPLGEPVVTTLQNALTRGYNHPNAILGDDQEIDTLAGAVGASKGTYRGPAVTISTARGNRVTVSPNHPVLTSRGWVTAQTLREGDHVFGPRERGRVPVRGFTTAHVDDVQTTPEDVFAALEVVGTRTSGPAAGHNFDDDRQFLQGEVHVVTTDGCLLPVPDPEVIKETGEVRFVWTDTDPLPVPSGSAEGVSLRGLGMGVGRPLSDSDTAGEQVTAQGGVRHAEDGGEFLTGRAAEVQGDQPVHIDGFPAPQVHPGGYEGGPHGRVGDSQEPGTVALAVPGGIESDQVVSVKVVEFSGHAYDFQTVDGVYSVGGVILHNCRHTIVPHIPGDAPSPDPGGIDPGDYKAVQTLRAHEVNIRKAKRAKAAALTPEARTKANVRLRAAQAALRHHIDQTGLKRVPLREQIDQAR